MEFSMDAVTAWLTTNALEIGIKLVAAIAFWVVGGILIRIAMNAFGRGLGRSKLDSTLRGYLISILSVVLKVVLIVAIFGYLGVETTTFAALLAGAGLAIGTAWGDLLKSFAAGIFLVILRPFKTGDFVVAGGVMGTVRDIGLFVTKIDTMDNVLHIVGNNKIFSEVIQNFSTNAYRRVDLLAQLNHEVDPNDAIVRLKKRLAAVANVKTDPAPDVEILEFNLAGPVLAVRPYCHNDDYWQVYFETNGAIRDEFGKAGYPVPEQHYHLRKAA